MASIISHHTISLDGFVAGPDDAMEWVGEYGPATSLAQTTMNRIGAVVAGRRWHELAKDRWRGVEGIYGGKFTGEVFVLTHRPPAEQQSRVHFVSGGLQNAISRAKEAADGKDIAIFGGSLTRQCIEQGLLDEIILHIAPVLLGSGVSLFGDTPRVELERVCVGVAERITDVRLRVRR
ncbi:MAG: dihydrofolate reductase family protein [Chloroflexi bacterium]|nr:dihydrofolate reductase family protein [Chloroflexota bacterium]